MADVIDTYTPKDMPAEVWTRVAPLVRQAVTIAEPKTPYRAEVLMSVMGGLVRWCDREGMPAELGEWLHPDTIDRYVFVGVTDRSEGTIANYRTQLRRVGAAVLGPPLYRVSVGIRERDPRAPYLDSEFADLVGWLRGLPTSHQQENALILIAMARGAGCASQDATRLIGDDVEDRGDQGVLVHVPGERARSVAVLRRWERHVAARAAAVGGRPLFLPGRTSISRRDISRFIDRLPRSDAPKLSVARLRNTWIVHHLAAGTSLRSLEAAAGCGAKAIADLAIFAPAIEAEKAYQAMRDASPEQPPHTP